NFHDGPLPRYAGLNATSWALLHQESSHGITWHAMTQDVDGGDILEQRLFDIGEGETSFSLNTKCYGAGIESFAALLTKLADGTVAPQKQPASEPHYFGRDKRPTGAASLRFTQPAAELEALVRALDFGPVDNPLGLPKLVVDGAITLVTKAEAVEGSGAPGTILAADLEGITVATSDGALRLLELKGLCGSLLSPETWLASRNKKVGDSLPSPSDEICDRVLAVHEGCARWEGFWAERLESLATPEIPYVDSAKAERAEPATLTVDERARGLGGVGLLGATLAYLARLCDAERLHVAYRDAAVQKSLEGAELFFSSHVPLEITLEGDTGFDGLRERLDKELARVHKRGSFPLDTALRHPALSARAGSLPKDLARVVVELTPAGQQPAKLADAGLTIAVAEDGSSLTLHAGPGLGAAAIATMLGQLDNFVKGVAVDGKRLLAQQSVLSEEEQRRLLVDFNATAKDYPKDATIHSLFEAQVAARPDAPALAYLEEELSYRELDARANRLAHHLRGLGVGPDVLVGVCVERSTEMLVATLGIMKAGGGYVPMDPEYPAERLAIMLEDSKVPVLITQERLLPHLPETSAQAICIDRDWPTIAKQPADKPAGGASPSNIAYTIYTSGSTGRPKGVMVEHRNAVSFFAGMDDSLGQSADTEPGVWLAVTSLSFDISVLELFWTLARGF
ncbi:MAG: AMP-binding protein, partial [Myxococcales bacterium]|nr:AMP-binding protein [Myxococcales bacterium]